MRNLEGDVEAMCNLSQGIYDDAVVKDIKNFMKNTKWDIDKCMDMLGVSEQRREIYRSIILGEEITA